jgi:polar amino acid transport system substrate-binding protein
VGAIEWPPYMEEELPTKGPASEITKLALEKAGYEVVFKFYPWKRLFASVKEGKIDAAIGISRSPERMEFFRYPSQTTFEDPKLVFYNKDKEVKENFTGEMRELCPENIGVIQGTYLHRLVEQAECLIPDTSYSAIQNVRKLVKGRFKYLLGSKTSTQLHLSAEEFSDEQRDRIEFYESPVETEKNYTVFSIKALEEKQYLTNAMNEFDKNLKIMKADGSYDKILKDHGLF